MSGLPESGNVLASS